VATSIKTIADPIPGDRIDPHEVMTIAKDAADLPLFGMCELQKAALCIASGVPVDYLGEGRWQLRFPCAIVETETELKVMVGR